MSKELAKAYEPQEVEDRIYDFWLKGNYFHAEIDQNKKPYTIVIPPPNITGQLHMGHALNNTLQDILIRWKRMQGYSALWIPGTDHASIATEAKIVEAMKEEGLSKDDLGREKFLERAWDWKKVYGGRIIEQLKKIGTSCDWERERFTLDEGCNKAVNHVFVKLYEKELIYRGERIINWCPTCKTSISDAEVEFDEKEGNFWHIKYPISDGSGFIQLATTRPETMLGDTAVAVHPEDDRYKHLIGKTVTLPIVNKEIPVVADTYVEPEFGTGVVKITPAHDPNDFEVGLRHNLPVINVMDESGVINELGGKFSGMDRYDARKAIVKELEDLDLLVKIEPIKHNVGTCYRCRTIVEPRVSTQWFLKMENLAKPAVDAVRTEEIKLIPERMDKTYYNWMENIKDWCVSRQLWWGHRIPAWYCACGDLVVSETAPTTCPKCGGNHLSQDEDTLDTWFSSALWPFSTLGWPENTPDFDYFYPTSTLVTAYDILFFWVSRMIFSGIEHTGKNPFDTVFFHGLIRDAQGRKMSKSLGNGIEPLGEVAKYGADALRYALATGNSPGNDMRYSEEKIMASRNFANKIWNAARFIHMNIEGKDVTNSIPSKLYIEDKWIISKFNALSKEITDNLDKFEFGIALSKLNDYIWDDYCDWYIELAKIRMNDKDEASANSARQTLVWILSNSMKLLHPFMPFITEEIWQSLPHEGEAIIVAPWPEYNSELEFTADSRDMEKIMDLIKAIRVRRGEMNVPPSKKATISIASEYSDLFKSCENALCKLAYATEIQTGDSFDIDGAVTVVTDSCTAYMPMAELIDFEAEKARLAKELESCEKQLNTANAKLNNEKFMTSAPENVRQGVIDNAEKLKEKIKMLEASLDNLK